MQLTRRAARRRPLALAALAGMAAVTFAMPAAQASPGLASSPTVRSSSTAGAAVSARSARLVRQATAHRALEQAQAVLAPKSSRAAHAQLASNRDATMSLRRAWMQRSSMSPADRASFDRLNARPATSRVKCGPAICVHWSPGETTAKYAAVAFNVMSKVHTTYIRAGYRGPKPDGKAGGNSKTDIYLDDIGNQGLYGYCTSDQKYLVSKYRHDVWAYCVLDNNFSHAEFPTNTPIENLKVTAAHEYFHANQYAYDAYEDRWWLEATATWAEDQLYDNVNDNLQYLRDSPLTKPGVSLDNGGGGNLGVYGRWIFFRYITEHFRAKRGSLPKIILEMFQAADSSRGRRLDRYSSQAINVVLKRKGSSLGKVFAQFSDANLRPAKTYSEGRANRYPGAPVSPFVLKPSHKREAAGARLNHLTSASAALIPRGFTGTGWKLRVRVNLGAQSRGSAAVVTTYLKNGRTTTKLVKLNKQGDGTTVTPFGNVKVVGVAVTLVNTSARFNCNKGTGYSCAGRPLDQNVAEKFIATAFK